jgi:hypothetical protein
MQNAVICVTAGSDDGYRVTDPQRASVARTETQVMTTDPVARARCRRYWSLVSPGVVSIRRTLLRGLKAEAERRMGESKPECETLSLVSTPNDEIHSIGIGVGSPS